MNENQGVCYLIAYDNGTIKAGKSIRIMARVNEHRAASKRFGINISHVFHTEPHDDFDATERLMLSTLKSIALNEYGEYFKGVQFDHAVQELSKVGIILKQYERTKKRGGKRSGGGRKPISKDGEAMKNRNFRATDAEWEKCLSLGGGTFLRAEINGAET